MLKGSAHKAVVLVHGLYGTPQQLQYIARKLNVQGGYTVHIPCIEGYSVSDKSGDRPDTKPWQSWLQALEAVLDELKTEYAHVSLGGLCVGATLCMALAMKRSKDIDTLHLYSAPLCYDGWNVTWMRWFKFLGYYSPVRFMMSLAERPPYGLKDERIRQWVAAQMSKRGTSALGSARSPLTGVVESERLMKYVKTRLAQITVPTLILHSVEDDLASPKNADRIERGISSRIIKKVLLDNCYHIITMDFEKETVARETLQFLNQHMVVTEKISEGRVPLHNAI